MNDQPTVRMKRRGVREYLRSESVLKEMKDRAQRIADDGNRDKPSTYYKTSTYVGKNRARAEVATASPRAIRSNQKSPDLLRALGRAQP